MRAWNSVDLIPADRKRVALLVKQELDSLGELGIVPGAERTMTSIAAARLTTVDDPALRHLTLDDMLAT